MSAGDLREQQVEAGGGDRVKVGPDGGQRRDVVGRLGHVVKADHAHVLGDAAAAFVQGTQDAEGEVVIGGEYRRGIGHPRQDLAVAVTGRGEPVGRHQRRYLGARLGQRPPPAGEAAAGVEPVVGPGDVPHGGMPGLEQVPRRRVRARFLVDRHQLGRPFRVAVDADERDVTWQVVKGVIGRLDRGDDDQARDALVEVAADRVGDRLAVEGAHALHVDGESALHGGLGQRAECRRRAV